tara:strand:+ start:113 stop:514 length:402 start_codon:yes stop_codon:yes gene_type:complete
MKSSNNWKSLNNVVLRVDNVEAIYTKKTEIILNCGFENISKGRCNLRVSVNNKNKKNNLYVFTDKALMEVELYYSKSEIDEILKLIFLKKSSKKSIIILNISDNLLINENNYLYIKNNITIAINSIDWKIPLS